jgi:peptidyl-prolyl cis-trans isomerase C
MVLAAAALGGCTRQAGPAPVAIVGNQVIAGELYDYYVRRETGVPLESVPEARRTQLLDELRQLSAAAQISIPQANTDTAQQVELARLEIRAHAAAESAGVLKPPTDAELASAYQQFKSSQPALEFHVAHILVATEARADALLVQLRAGADFAALAREHSADASASHGGDVGWIVPGKLPPAFTDAVVKLKVGQFSAKPVHTTYGWHLIRLLETQLASVPPFEQVRAQLAVNLREARYHQFLEQSLQRVAAR